MITAARVILHILQGICLAFAVLGTIAIIIASDDPGPNDHLMIGSFTMLGILAIAFSPTLWSIPPVKQKRKQDAPAPQMPPRQQHHNAPVPPQGPYGGRG
ncbi:hypothetical protein O4J56_26930 [Nocardiopsis sp. RSe5-2]|uniref:Uncharacterized protein n=1 Tax=Nocardiopsis endophytica TaxID=3018445 RepID=A0ABT4UC35_9ACTN|nr:hypothetical protein [Nocardiopsis endophytica]MDA2814311.1 hypothetical protein [Nocardiopsis endophytica]